MESRNILMRAGIRALDKDFCESLGEEIESACNADPDMQINRRALYFQLEPFVMEIKDPPKGSPVKRENYDEYADWVNRRLQGVKNQGLKILRASFFGWLSYYHPQRAQALLDKHNSKLPLYQGHPNLERCSDEAKARFRRQDREVDQEVAGEETKDPALPKGSPKSAISQQTSPEPTSFDDLGSGPEAPTKETAGITVPENSAQERPSQNENQAAGVENTHQKNAGEKRKLVVIGLLVALLFVSGAVAINPSIFGSSSEGQNTADGPASPSLAVNDKPASSEETTQDESGTDSKDAGPAESEAENEPAVSASKLPREINPVWNNITGFAWSTKELNYFYPTLRSANRSDLLEAARQGNTAAQTLMGVAYHSGWLGQTDHGLAIREYLRPACANGQGLAQGRACALLGVHYSAGLGVPKNNAAAAEFYSKACRIGNLTGCHYEGIRYLNGEGVAQDLPRAITILKDACELGVGYSCLKLSDTYGQGNGVEKDLELSRRYQQRYQRLRTPI